MYSYKVSVIFVQF